MAGRFAIFRKGHYASSASTMEDAQNTRCSFIKIRLRGEKGGRDVAARHPLKRLAGFPPQRVGRHPDSATELRVRAAAARGLRSREHGGEPFPEGFPEPSAFHWFITGYEICHVPQQERRVARLLRAMCREAQVANHMPGLVSDGHAPFSAVPGRFTFVFED
jgi:hypothetical protein